VAHWGGRQAARDAKIRAKAATRPGLFEGSRQDAVATKFGVSSSGCETCPTKGLPTRSVQEMKGPLRLDAGRLAGSLRELG
jgi:hypothetical protein